MARQWTVSINHGFEGSVNGNWFPWLKRELTARGITVATRQMPDAQWPSWPAWKDAMSEMLPAVGPGNIIVAHSLGCLTVLKWLTECHPDAEIAGGVLVSGFAEPLPELSLPASFFTTPLDASRLKGHWTVISARNDALVPHALTRKLAEKIGADFVAFEEGGHFMAEEGYTEFPFVLKCVENLAGL